MEFLPWKTFGRIVARYGGDDRVRTLNCGEQYRVMAFAQLTYRESLRDIETCLSVQASKALPHGLARTDSALDAGRCQRSARLAHLRGSGPAVDRPGEEAVRHGGSWSGPDQYGLRLGFVNHRPVPVGLSVGSLPHHQGGGEDAHPARFARQHPELHSRVGRQTGRRACARSAASRSRCHLCYGSWLCRFRPPSCVASGGGLLRDAHQIEHDAHRVYSAPTDRTNGIICDQSITLDGHYTSKNYPEQLRRVRLRDAVSGKTLVFLSNHFALPALTIAALYKNRWQVELFFKWIKQHLRIKQFYGTSENAVKTQIWIAVSVYVLVAIVKKRLELDASLYTLLQILLQ